MKANQETLKDYVDTLDLEKEDLAREKLEKIMKTANILARELDRTRKGDFVE